MVGGRSGGGTGAGKGAIAGEGARVEGVLSTSTC